MRVRRAGSFSEVAHAFHIHWVDREPTRADDRSLGSGREAERRGAERRLSETLWAFAEWGSFLPGGDLRPRCSSAERSFGSGRRATDALPGDVNGKPAFDKLCAIGVPILPSPIQPMCFIFIVFNRIIRRKCTKNEGWRLRRIGVLTNNYFAKKDPLAQTEMEILVG